MRNLKNSLINIGIVGFSDESKYKKSDGEKAVLASFNNIAELFPDREIHIVSGLSNVGIPKLAYIEAVKRGWRTVGIAPREVEPCDSFPVDDVIIVGSKFGDESQTFIDYIAILVKIGGGKQSQKELQMAKDRGLLVMDMESYFE